MKYKKLIEMISALAPEERENVEDRILDSFCKNLQVNIRLFLAAYANGNVDAMFMALTGCELDHIMARAKVIPPKARMAFSEETPYWEITFPNFWLDMAEAKQDTTAEPDWFGVVRWSKADIEKALGEKGYEPKGEAVSIIRRQCEHHGFTDRMIETGWDCIDFYIEECEEQLAPYKTPEAAEPDPEE